MKIFKELSLGLISVMIRWRLVCWFVSNLEEEENKNDETSELISGRGP
jgi:hypothetical protein